MIFEKKFPSVKHGMLSLAELMKGKKGVLVIFTSIQCPYALAYYSKIEEISAKEFFKDISFVFVNSNQSTEDELETIDEMRTQFNNLNTPYIKDEDKELCNQFTAQFTPHSFLLNQEWNTIYEGAIDSWFKPPSEYVEGEMEKGFPWDDELPISPQITFIEEVLSAYLHEKSIPFVYKTAIGCIIK